MHVLPRLHRFDERPLPKLRRRTGSAPAADAQRSTVAEINAQRLRIVVLTDRAPGRNICKREARILVPHEAGNERAGIRVRLM
jgi:hypothetical protein